MLHRVQSVQSVSLFCVALQQSRRSLCVDEDWGRFFGFVLGLFWARTLRETVGGHETFGREATQPQFKRVFR